MLRPSLLCLVLQEQSENGKAHKVRAVPPFLTKIFLIVIFKMELSNQ